MWSHLKNDLQTLHTKQERFLNDIHQVQANRTGITNKSNIYNIYITWIANKLRYVSVRQRIIYFVVRYLMQTLRSRGWCEVLKGAITKHYVPKRDHLHKARYVSGQWKLFDWSRCSQPSQYMTNVLQGSDYISNLLITLN